MYGSVATDFSAVASEGGFLYEFDNSTIANSQFDGDIIHFGGGISLELKWVELTMGTAYGASERTIRRPLNFGDDQFFDPDATSTLSFSRWRFIFGFSFPFAANVTKKLNID